MLSTFMHLILTAIGLYYISPLSLLTFHVSHLSSHAFHTAPDHDGA